MLEGVYKLDQHFSHVPMIDNVNSRDLQNIRDWIQQRPYLPYITDRQISIFLHSCYGAVELTKHTIESYYVLRTQTDAIFCNRTADECATVFRIAYMVKPPALSVDKCHMICTGLIDTDGSKWNTVVFHRVFFALIDIYTNLVPYASGWRLCLDAKHFSFTHLMKLSSNIGLIKKTISYVQDGLPTRLKGVHIRNANPIVCQFVGVIKPFMKKELYDLIHMHPSEDPLLYKYFHKKSLPTLDPDGEGEPALELLKETMAVLRKYEKWFQDDEYLARIDESKRSTPKASRTSVFGFGRWT